MLDVLPVPLGRLEFSVKSDPQLVFSGGCKAIIRHLKFSSSLRKLVKLGVLHIPPENSPHLRVCSSEARNCGDDPGTSKKVRSCEGGSDYESERKKHRVWEEEISGEMVCVGRTEADSVAKGGIVNSEWLDFVGNVETVDGLGESLGGEAGDVEASERRVFEDEDIENIDQVREMVKAYGKEDIGDGTCESVVDKDPTDEKQGIEDSGRDILDGLIEMPEYSTRRNEGKRPLEDEVLDEDIGLMEMHESNVPEGTNKCKRTLEVCEKDVVDQNIGLLEICESTVVGNEDEKRDGYKHILENMDNAELMKIYKSWSAGKEGLIEIPEYPVGINEGKRPLEVQVVEESIGLMEMQESIVHEGRYKGEKILEDIEMDVVVGKNIGLVGICESTVVGNEDEKRDGFKHILETVDNAELMEIYKSWSAGKEGQMHFCTVML